MQCKIKGALAITVALVASSAGLTQANQDLASMMIAKLVEHVGDFSDGPCAAMSYAEELKRRTTSNLNLALAGARIGICRITRNENAQALADLQQAEALLPSGPEGDKIAEMIDLPAILSAVFVRDVPSVKKHLLHIAARGSTRECRALQITHFGWGLRLVPTKDRAEIALAFARSPCLTALHPVLRAQIIDLALLPAIDQGDQPLAKALVLELSNPRDLVAKLIDTRFATAWTLLAERAGPKLERALSDHLVSNGQNSKTISRSQIQTLLFVGFLAEAADLAARIDHEPKALLKLSEDDSQILQFEVQALDGLGKAVEGDAILSLVLDQPDQNQSWLVALHAQRVFRLISRNQWSDAATAADHFEQIAKTLGTPYSQVAAASAQLCTAFHVAPSKVNDVTTQKLMESWGANPGAVAAAMACVGRDSDARKVISAALKDEERRSDMLLLLQPRSISGNPLYLGIGNFPSIDLRKFLNDEALASVYRLYGRDLPEAMLPAPLSRLAIPARMVS